MKIAIVYNRDSERVINLFGIPNREKYGKPAIKRIVGALKQGGHQVATFEGDKDIIDHLEEFMPRVVKGERPGMVFNLSYGIQGQARYTHVPGILEMVGIPYVGSDPLAHSLSLDKVVAKTIFAQRGIPTPPFAVLDGPDFAAPDLEYPLIVKPKNEAVSFGLRIVSNEEELREAAGVILETYQQPALVERYIEGREINVGLLGNQPPETFPPAEVLFGEEGPPIYTYEDKTRQSGRNIGVQCPADIDETAAERAKEISLQAFAALGCKDCARVDMRLDGEGNLYVLEINSLPSLGEHGSYVQGAAAVGMDFTALVNRLVDTAATRYFGFPSPRRTKKEGVPSRDTYNFLVEHRDRLEERLKHWVSHSSRTSDPVGLAEAKKELGKTLEQIGMEPVPRFTDDRVTWLWQSKAGFENGTLLIAHVDVPLSAELPVQAFHKDPEQIYGEGIASSRGPLVAAEYAFRAIRSTRSLRKLPVGILYYTDEGRDCRYSGRIISEAAEKAARVIVLRPSIGGRYLITARRGLRTYNFTVETQSLALSQAFRKTDAFRWMMEKLVAFQKLSSKDEHLSVIPVDARAFRTAMRLPHQAWAGILMTSREVEIADEAEGKMRSMLKGEPVRWRLEKLSDRPPMKATKAGAALARDIERVAAGWDISIRGQTSAMPSAAGLVPNGTPVVCGMGPVAENLYTLHESIGRLSLLKRTVLLAEYLLSTMD